MDRWAWTNNASNGMLPIWTGDAISSTAPKFDAAKRMSETIKKMEDSANPYSFDTSGLPEE